MENIGFKMHIWNRLIMAKGHIAQETLPISDSNRKWIAIYPYNKNENKFKIFEIELPKSIVEADLDWSEEVEVSKEFFFKSENELKIFLNENKISIEKFDTPWNVKYPYH